MFFIYLLLYKNEISDNKYIPEARNRREGLPSPVEGDDEESGIGRPRFSGSVVASKDRAEVGDGAKSAWQRRTPRRRKRFGRFGWTVEVERLLKAGLNAIEEDEKNKMHTNQRKLKSPNIHTYWFLQIYNYQKLQN